MKILFTIVSLVLTVTLKSIGIFLKLMIGMVCSVR